MFREFKEFAMRGNVVDMAVGIIIGGAFGTIVKSLVSDVIMPPIGLLLGGVFTMLYGVGWIISSEANVARFVVMTIALVVTLGLGHMRFVRRMAGGDRGAPGVAGSGPEPEGGPGTSDGEMERRLSEVEDRLRAEDGILSVRGLDLS